MWCRELIGSGLRYRWRMTITRTPARLWPGASGFGTTARCWTNKNRFSGERVAFDHQNLLRVRAEICLRGASAFRQNARARDLSRLRARWDAGSEQDHLQDAEW